MTFLLPPSIKGLRSLITIIAIHTQFRSSTAIFNFRRVIFCGRESWTLNPRNITVLLQEEAKNGESICLFILFRWPFCLCDLYGSRDFGFVRFCQRREHFLFIMVCVSLMDGLTENKAQPKPRADVHFRLKESYPFRGMVCILVLNRKFCMVFSFLFMLLKFKLAKRLFQIQLVLEVFLIKSASHVIKPLYQG